jgi:hypothetical protein
MLTSVIPVAAILGNTNVKDVDGYYHSSDMTKCVCDYNNQSTLSLLLCYFVLAVPF